MDEITSEDFYLDFCIEYNYAEPVNCCSLWLEIYGSYDFTIIFIIIIIIIIGVTFKI